MGCSLRRRRAATSDFFRSKRRRLATFAKLQICCQILQQTTARFRLYRLGLYQLYLWMSAEQQNTVPPGSARRHARLHVFLKKNIKAVK